jgi:hypothetical protein
MFKRLLMASVAVVVALGGAGNASAQDTVQRTGSLPRAPSYTSLTTAIGAIAAATERINTRVVTAADIRVVNAVTVIGSENDEAIRKALEQSMDQLILMRSAIAKNQVYVTALSAHQDKPEARDVIAVDILATGDVLVYFRKGNVKKG